MESKQLHSIIGIWTNACRFLLAAVFIFSGFVKAVDPLGIQYKIQDYLEVFGWVASVPAFLPFLASVLQAMVAFCLGVYLLFGIRRRMTTLFVVLIMGVMTPLTLWLALSNPISDCGCFGDAVTLTNWETFGKNVLLLIAAVSVFKWGNRITPLVTKRFDWLVAMYTFLYISGMTLYCYRELPVFDFRPYHIGADIRKGMEIPEGEKPTVYETRFILQKDGVEKEFTLENYSDMADSVAEIYKDIVIADAPSYSSGISEFTNEQRKTVVEQLGRSGLVSVEEDTAMQNHEAIEAFYADYLDGQDSMVTVFEVQRDGLIGAVTFIYRKGELQTYYIGIRWREGGMPEIQGTSVSNVAEIKLTEKGYFIYAYEYVIAHASLRQYWRIEPLPEDCRELTEK